MSIIQFSSNAHRSIEFCLPFTLTWEHKSKPGIGLSLLAFTLLQKRSLSFRLVDYDTTDDDDTGDELADNHIHER